jgi:putative ABC transport system permease protein
MKNDPGRPPRIPRLILSCMKRYMQEHAVQIELEEEFEEIADQKGRLFAILWYWGQVVYSVPAYFRLHLTMGGTMLSNYLKIALRNIKRNKAYSIINIAGLSVGITCSLLILLFIRFETSFDRYHPNADQIYRVIFASPTEFMGTNKQAFTPGPLAQTLKDEFPEVRQITRIEEAGSDASLSYKNISFTEEAFYYTDPGYLKMFAIPLLKGDQETALDNPFSLLISEEKAAEYFGSGDPLGKILRLNDRYDFQVTGVFPNIPQNTHFHADFFASFKTLDSLYGLRSLSSWNGFNYQTYIQLGKETSPVEFENKMTAFLRKKGPDNLSYLLQPLTGIHLGGNIPGELAQNSHVRYMYIFAAIAVLIILITCCNYINLATARLALRANEVGLRKVVGAKRGQLIRQFLGESFVFTCLAMICALVLLVVCLPSFNAFAGTKLDLSLLKTPHLLAGITVLFVAICLASGYYPALYLSSLKPAQTLKSAKIRGSKGSRIFRNTLVTIQFAITTVLIISTIIIRKQMTFITDAYTGQMEEVTVTLPVNRDNSAIQETIEVFKEELKKDPAILNVSASSWLPTRIRAGNYALWEDKREDQKVLFHNLEADYDFCDLYGIPVIEGRGFSKDFPSDPEQAYLINETAVKAMQMDNPIGRRFGYPHHQGVIIGVIRDFHFVPMHLPIRPLAVRLNTAEMRFISIKVNPVRLSQTLGFIETKWKEITPGFAFTYSFFDDAVDELYRSEERLNLSLRFFSVLAVFLACLGLFGLVLFSIEQRTKEVGIRKVLGAGTVDIVSLLSKDFLRLVGAANIIAWPLSFYAANKWLQSFAYRTSLDLWVFAAATVTVLAISVLTIAYQAVKAAVTNPVDSLRYE